MVETAGLFGEVREFPSPSALERYEALVGLDEIKTRLLAQAHVLLVPEIAQTWSTACHGSVLRAVDDLLDRTPLILLAGDVGTGKTELAETVGDSLARKLNKPVFLHPLSLSARGHGAVGEMTTLITKAFEAIHSFAKSGRGSNENVRHASLLLIDEADALAQSRELTQMHHEDRAGVNALIRGIDWLRSERLPVLTIMCTNRVDALDPALQRRAADVLRFDRPSEAVRRDLLERSFSGAGISAADLDEVVRLTGARNDRLYGCTHSDLRQRFVPTAVLLALGQGKPITGDLLIGLGKTFEPTRPFEAELANE